MAFFRSTSSELELPETANSTSPVLVDKAGDASLLVLGSSWSKELLLDEAIVLLAVPVAAGFLFFPLEISYKILLIY